MWSACERTILNRSGSRCSIFFRSALQKKWKPSWGKKEPPRPQWGWWRARSVLAWRRRSWTTSLSAGAPWRCPVVICPTCSAKCDPLTSFKITYFHQSGQGSNTLLWFCSAFRGGRQSPPRWSRLIELASPCLSPEASGEFTEMERAVSPLETREPPLITG